MIHLVRHLAAGPEAQGRCYGWSDVPLSDSSLAAMPALAQSLALLQPSVVITSDLTRCRVLAEAVAARLRCRVIVNARWRERHFGAWEMQAWDALHTADPAAIDRLMEPSFAPSGGESLLGLQARILAAWDAVPPGALVIAHGGAIAMVRCHEADQDLSRAAAFIPGYGEIVTLDGHHDASPVGL